MKLRSLVHSSVVNLVCCSARSHPRSSLLLAAQNKSRQLQLQAAEPTSDTAAMGPSIAPLKVYVVNPRRKAGQSTNQIGGPPVEISLQLLRQYFDRPLSDLADELGLSSTAIKKACRSFGIMKWPFRALTAHTSRNRAAMKAMAQRLDEGAGIVDYRITESPTVQTPQRPASPPVNEVEEQSPAEPHDRSVSHAHTDEPSDSPIWIDDTEFLDNSRCSSAVTDLELSWEYMDEIDGAASAPLEPAEVQELPSPGLFCKHRPETDLVAMLMGDMIEPSPLETLDSELFQYNTGQ